MLYSLGMTHIQTDRTDITANSMHVARTIKRKQKQSTLK